MRLAQDRRDKQRKNAVQRITAVLYNNKKIYDYAIIAGESQSKDKVTSELKMNAAFREYIKDIHDCVVGVSTTEITDLPHLLMHLPSNIAT